MMAMLRKDIQEKGFQLGRKTKAHPETVPCYYPVQALVFSALP